MGSCGEMLNASPLVSLVMAVPEEGICVHFVVLNSVPIAERMSRPKKDGWKTGWSEELQLDIEASWQSCSEVGWIAQGSGSEPQQGGLWALVCFLQH